MTSSEKSSGICSRALEEGRENVTGTDRSLLHKLAEFGSGPNLSQDSQTDKEGTIEGCTTSTFSLFSEHQAVSSFKVSPKISTALVKKRILPVDANSNQVPAEGSKSVVLSDRKIKRACEHQGYGIPGFDIILGETFQTPRGSDVRTSQTYHYSMPDQKMVAPVDSACEGRVPGMRENHREFRLETIAESAEDERSNDSVEKTALTAGGFRRLGAAKRIFTNSKFRIPARVPSDFGSQKQSEKCLNVMPLPELSGIAHKRWSIPKKAGTVNECPAKVEDKVESGYYYVMYCIRKPNAKHKGPWSDGIVIHRGRSAILQDTERKVISKDGDQLCRNLSEGATVLMGKFEVEVMSRTTEEEVISGKVFSGLDGDALTKQTCKRTLKSFRVPSVKQARVSADGNRLAVSSEEVDHAFGKNDLVLNSRDPPGAGVRVIVDPYLALKLRPHQREGVKFMYECVMGSRNSSFTGCLLADAMGLGKTLQVIALIWTLLKQGPGGHPAVKRVLVITPSSLVDNWGKEVRQWLGNERLTPLLIHSGTSPKDVKRKLFNFQAGKLYHLLITSYELVRKYKDDLKSAKPELLVCDEAHRLKNCAGNKTIDALLDLQCSKRLMLTGTPIQNDLMEFYAMIDFANPNLLGSLSTFKRLYANPIEKSRDRDAEEGEKILGRERSAELQSKTRFCILQRTADVNSKYLPSKTEFVVFCKLEQPQIALYQKFIRSKTVSESLEKGQSAVVLSAIGTLRKLCNHPRLVEHELSKQSGNVVSSKDGVVPKDLPAKSWRGQEKSSADWGLSGKFSCLERLLSAMHGYSSAGSKDKMVVVSNFTQTLDIIQILCDGHGWSWLRLDGGTPVSERQALVDRFNANWGEERVFLLSSKAGGSGLNLIGANRLVLFDPDWNPATDAQAMARVWRDGQTKVVFIYRLLTTGSIEEKIYQRQIMKGEVAAAVEEQVEGLFGAGDHTRRHFSRDELRELFTLHLETCCDTYDLLSQSNSSHSDWRDYSKDVEDHALREAIKTGVVTFVYQNINDKKDIKSSFDRSHDEVDSTDQEEQAGLYTYRPDVRSDPADTATNVINQPRSDCEQQLVTESEDATIQDHQNEGTPFDCLESKMPKRVNGANGQAVDDDTNPRTPAPVHRVGEMIDCVQDIEGDIMRQMMELPAPAEHDVDELEALDAPFLCTLDLEMELKSASFSSEDLWQGFKLFAIGFLLGGEEDRVSYRNCKLGLILGKCNVYTTADDVSIFSKGLRLVRAVISRRYGHQAANLSYLSNFYEGADLKTSSKGR